MSAIKSFTIRLSFMVHIVKTEMEKDTTTSKRNMH